LDVADWDIKATELASRFIQNFSQYVDDKQCFGLVKSGPQIEKTEA
jgi:ATP-dependent phosphoenolpyruvate carboxykinase